MLAWAGRIADGQGPTATSGATTRPGQPLLLAGLVKLFGPSLLAWRVLRLASTRSVALLAYVLDAPRGAGEGWALARLAGGRGRDGVPDRAGAERDGAGAGARRDRAGAAARAGRRRARGARRASSAPEIGVACAIGRDASRRAAVARRASAGAALAVAVARSARSWSLLGGDMLPQTVGFVDEQRLQRLPFPLVPHVGFDPEQAARVLDAADPRARAARRGSCSGGRRWALAPLRARRARLPARAHRRVPPRAAVGRAGGAARLCGGRGARRRHAWCSARCSR